MYEWMSHYIHYNVLDKITYRFPNFNDCTAGVWESMLYLELHNRNIGTASICQYISFHTDLPIKTLTEKT